MKTIVPASGIPRGLPGSASREAEPASTATDLTAAGRGSHSATALAAFTVLDLPDGDRTLIGLARVSTDAQDAQLQHDALAAAECGRVYTEKTSTT